MLYEVITPVAADDHRADDPGESPGDDARSEDRGKYGDGHADDAVEVAPSGGFLVGQAAQAET